MSLLKPQVWHLQCARCLRATVVVREVWDPYAELLCGFDAYPPESTWKYLGGREKEDEQFLVLCPSCTRVVNRKGFEARSIFCFSCFRPLLMLTNVEENTTHVFGGKANVMTIGSQPLVGQSICNACAILSTLHAG